MTPGRVRLPRKPPGRVVPYFAVEGRRQVREYVRWRTGAYPRRVRFWCGSGAGCAPVRVWLHDGCRLDGYCELVPLGFDDAYPSVHLCWVTPCAHCRERWGLV